MAGWADGERPASTAGGISPWRWLARQVGLLDVLGEPGRSIRENRGGPPGYLDTGLAGWLGRIADETWEGLSEHFSGEYGPSEDSLRRYVATPVPMLNYANRLLLKGGGTLLDLAGRTVTAPFAAAGAGGGQAIREIEDNPRSASANAFRRDLNLLSQIAPLVAGQSGLPRIPRASHTRVPPSTRTANDPPSAASSRRSTSRWRRRLSRTSVAQVYSVKDSTSLETVLIGHQRNPSTVAQRVLCVRKLLTGHTGFSIGPIPAIP